MAKEGERVRPFSCGTQYADWQESNCERCAKGVDWDAPFPDSKCDLERALSRASVGDGTISADVARRIALPLAAPGPYVWPCGELEVVR